MNKQFFIGLLVGIIAPFIGFSIYVLFYLELDLFETINIIIRNNKLSHVISDKENYSNYFDLIVEKLDKNGIIIADNVLWSGKVILKDKDTETLALDNYNKKTSEDSRVENLLIGIRDGLMISRKIK